MKSSSTNRFLCWVLIYAFTLMQVSPAWANAGASGSSGGGSQGGGGASNGSSGGSGGGSGGGAGGSSGGGGPAGGGSGGSGGSGGGGGAPKGSGGDPVDMKSGNSYFSESDLVFNTPGVPVAFRRTYNSTETYNSPFGKGWSQSMDWRLHQAREIITKVVPPVTNENFRINLWEGTQLLCDGQMVTNYPNVDTNGVTNGWIEVHQTNLVTAIPEFLYGSPVKDQVDAYVAQPGNQYAVDLDQPYTYGTIGGTNPVPVIGLQDADSNSLPMDGITYETNQWLEVYRGDGNSTRLWDTDTNGVYWAIDRNWKITSTNDLWILHLPAGEERIFSADGRMIRHQNGWGVGINFTYNTSGELITAAHDDGLTLQFTYTDGHIVSVSAGSGAALTYSYTNGLLETVTQQYGSEQRTRRFEYTNGFMTKRINPEGHEYLYGYALDAASNLTAKAVSGSVNPGNWMQQSVVYQSDTLADFVTYPRGIEHLHRYAYSSKNGLQTDLFGPGTNTVDAETRGVHYDYDVAKNEIERTDFDDNTGAFFSALSTYDGRHNRTSDSLAYCTTSPVPVSTTTWNQTFMLPATILNAEGEKTSMTYTNGSLVKLRAFYAESNSWNTLCGYTTNGLLAVVTNANSHAVQYTYDSRGYPETVIPAAGPRVKTVYNDFGFLTRSEILPEGATNGTGRVTQYSINPLGWIESVTYADGLIVSNQYNKLGDLTNVVDRAGRVTEFTYTPESRLASETQYLEQNGSNIPVRISYDYDQQFNTLSITEPRGRYVESYQLDIQDRIVAVTNIEGQTMTFGYSVGSMVTNLTRFDGSQIATTYDTAGKKSSAYYLAPDNQQLSTINYAYYADSQLKTISDGITTVSNAYDRLNRLTHTVSSIGTLQSSIANAYDSVGNLTNTVLSGSLTTNSLETSFTYDSAERLTGIFTTEGTETQSFVYVYSPVNGRVETVSNETSGIVMKYVFDLMDRATNITYRTDSGEICSVDYQFNASGMITNKATQINGQTTVTEYTYDSIDRLVKEQSGSDATEFQYDLAGNRTAVIKNSETNIYTTGIGNRLSSWGTNGAAQYNEAGCITNLTAGDGTEWALTWDEKYQITSVSSVSSVSSVVNYSYDVLNRRSSRTEGSSTEHYVYNGNQIAADLDASGNVLRTYTWGPGIDNLLSITVHGESATNTYYALKDHQNSVLALTDISGNVVERYSYDAYGHTTIFDSTGNELTESAYGNRYLWQGREFDSATGLYFFRARWYSPEIGRFISKDLIGIAGGFNLYAFCENNPVNFVDPYGQFEVGPGYGFGVPASAMDAYDATAQAEAQGYVAGAAFYLDPVGAAAGLASYAGNCISSGTAPTSGGIAGAAVGGAVSSKVGSALGGGSSGKIAGGFAGGLAGGAVGGKK